MIQKILVTNVASSKNRFNIFCLHLSNIDDSNTIIPAGGDRGPERRLNHFIFTEQDVVDLLKHLDVKKATRPDYISQVMLKKAGQTIIPSLTNLLNFSLSTSQIPLSWKMAKVTTVFF